VYYKRLEHWRRLVKNIGEANPNFGKKNVVKILANIFSAYKTNFIAMFECTFWYTGQNI